MLRIFITIAMLASCAADNQASPDAAPQVPFNPTGTWTITNAIGADTCGNAAMSEPKQIAIIGTAIGIPGETLVPGGTITCNPNSCDASFAVNWTASGVYRLEEFVVIFEASGIASGSGKLTTNNGSTTCRASFSTAGSKS